MRRYLINRVELPARNGRLHWNSETQKKPRVRRHHKTNDHTIKLVTDPIVRVGLIQMACSRDPGENLAKAEWRIREAAGKGAQIICLQELFRSQYFCHEEDARLFDLAESIPGPTTGALAGLARDLKVVIIASLFERRAAGVYHNTAAVIDADGSLVGIYRKMHIPDDPLYFEKYYFTPGDLGFRVFDT